MSKIKMIGCCALFMVACTPAIAGTAEDNVRSSAIAPVASPRFNGCEAHASAVTFKHDEGISIDPDRLSAIVVASVTSVLVGNSVMTNLCAR